MGDPRSNGSELDRRSSRRASTRLSNVLDDHDDDDYVLQAMAISDGFRPVEVAHNHNGSHISRPSVSSLEPPVARAMSPRPSSVSKPPPVNESFSLPYNRLERSPARSSGASTDSPVMSAETPYEGPLGPSHPYQMYPQDVRLARTASLATTSTAPISERSYNGPGRPTHPYGIYPQNVAPGIEESDSPSPQREINVGFPGASDDYQRRLGPDGEEAADMIGPDGHTEQLPPYTRYPVEAYAQKALGINVTQSALPSSPARQNLEIPGAGGIGLATRNPEFSSTEDLNQLSSPQSRRSIRSFASEASHHSINTAALAVTNEKREPNWKTAARRKVWGVVPCWAVVLGVIVLVMLGVVVGTVIGTVYVSHLNNKHSNSDDNPPYEATNPVPGFVPLPTVPPDLPPLAEGPYSLPLIGPRYSNTCFQDPSQGRAWNCEAIMSQLTMSIHQRQSAADIPTYWLNLTYNQSYTQESYIYTYGVQPPFLLNQQLQLVNDNFERSRGPAWAFALPYNKTIILPEEYLTPNNSSSLNEVQRRMMFGFDFKRKGLAQTGEKPWICTWPDTLLEVFIYARQNSSVKFSMSSGSDTGASSSPLPTEAPAGDQGVTAYHRDARGQSHGHDFTHTPPPPLPPSSSAPPSTSSTSSTEPNYFGHPPMPPPMLPSYPRVMKVEERRNSQIKGPVPVCRQVEILDKGVPARPVPDETGKQVEIQIAEVVAEDEEKESGYFSRRRSPDEQLWNRDISEGNELSDCGCIWWVT
ncbi:hypothetical protein F4801DRAFT_353632 [Xylaria longipes]|nr:hypothetical protein F4801DRAFT_353632 [Xylaria longipes]RYC53738.1 hypothetical protein CHU98_g12472 [Xylaria longipes]